MSLLAWLFISKLASDAALGAVVSHNVNSAALAVLLPASTSVVSFILYRHKKGKSVLRPSTCILYAAGRASIHAVNLQALYHIPYSLFLAVQIARPGAAWAVAGRGENGKAESLCLALMTTVVVYKSMHDAESVRGILCLLLGTAGYSACARFESRAIRGTTEDMLATTAFVCAAQSGWAFLCRLPVGPATMSLGYTAILPILLVAHAMGIILTYLVLAESGPVATASISSLRRILSLLFALYVERSLSLTTFGGLLLAGVCSYRLGISHKSRQFPVPKGRLAEMV